MKLAKLIKNALFRRNRVESDMADELRFHLDSRVEDLVRRGLPKPHAERQARIEFGGVEAYKERCREASGFRWFDEIRRNVLYAFRTIRMSPGFAAASVFSLALGIGVNISSFNIVNALVLKPLPYPNLERIMTVWAANPKNPAQRSQIAAGDFFDFKTHSTAFERLAAYRPWDVMLTSAGEPERVQAALVTSDYFDAFGMQPMWGRNFQAGESEPGSDDVAVVSYGFWKSRMASLPQPVGKTISLGGRVYKVIGVMPDEFDFPLATELWAPLALPLEARGQRRTANLTVIGRLRSGYTPAQAHAEMRSLAAALEQRYPQTNEGRSVRITPLRELTNQVTDRFVLVCLGAAAFVLLLACANVGNLQLVRSAARRREMGIRAALGASRNRIAGQLLTESIVISVMGGVLGLLLAYWSLPLQKARIPDQVFRWVAGMRTLHLDATDLAFAFTVSMLAGVLCGLPSIFQLLREAKGSDANSALKEGGRGASSGPARNRAGSALVALELALALVLLVAAGLMVGTFERLLAFHPGFDAKNLLTMEVALSEVKYRDNVQIARFYSTAIERLQALSGVEAAGASGGVGRAAKLFIEGRSEPRPGDPRPYISAITPRYFEAMRIPILKGRSIGEQDGADAPPAVVISESMARNYWPNSSPIGEKIRFGASSPAYTIEGVCGDIKDWFGGNPQAAAYLSYRQSPPSAMRIVLRTTRDPAQSANSARAEVRGVDKNQPLYNVKTMEQILSEETSGVRSAANMMQTFAFIALLLAVMGTYAVGAFFVVQRTQEIGIRVALGATRRDIVSMVLGKSAVMASIGLGIGLSLAVLLTQIMSHALYGLVEVEPMAFVTRAGVLALAALAAAYAPARRAALVDPIVALRTE